MRVNTAKNAVPITALGDWLPEHERPNRGFSSPVCRRLETEGLQRLHIRALLAVLR